MSSIAHVMFNLSRSMSRGSNVLQMVFAFFEVKVQLALASSLGFGVWS